MAGFCLDVMGKNFQWSMLSFAKKSEKTWFKTYCVQNGHKVGTDRVGEEKASSGPCEQTNSPCILAISEFFLKSIVDVLLNSCGG